MEISSLCLNRKYQEYATWNIGFGRIPSSIGNCTSLTLLDLADNSFDGLIPNTIVNLKNLQKLNLAHNALTIESSTLESSFINSLTNNMHLRRIVLSGNPLDTMLPMSIGNLSTSLEYLWLTDCKLHGRIPSEVGNLSSLVALRLGNNELTGVIPNTIGRLQKLQGLHLQGNKLQGTILYDFCKLSSLFELFLSGNELSGLIPECLSNLTTLRNLSLSSNRLTSTIPSSLWSLRDILAINMSSNSLQGSLPFDIENLKVVIEIDLSKNQFSGYIPDSWNLQSLEYLSLAVNRLQGLIPESLVSSLSLEFLDLSHNKLSGVIPKSLVQLHLMYFNVSFNELEGEIPSGGTFDNFTARSYVMNKALCGAARLQVPTCRTGTSKRSRRPILTLAKILLPIIASMCILPQMYRAIKHCLKKRKDPLLTTNRTILYEEIVLATDGFSESNIIGTGSFGSVYKGAMKEEKNVAIKVFNLHPERGLRSFQVESELLSNTRHPNLVKLMNSCCDDDFRALVLEYMPNGTLDKWLYTHNYFLNLLQRLDIMIEVASAMSYLHSIHVIHCDLKPSNILLDEDMIARVSDFSVAKRLGENATMQTRTMATMGYMAPEYGSSGIISEKTDVYSFGILLMATFTGKKPTDDMFDGEMNLRLWIYESLPHAVDRFIDVSLLQSDQEDIAAKTKCVRSIMKVAWFCTAESSLERKTMAEVQFELHRIKSRFLIDTELIECEEMPREIVYPRISYQELKLATDGFSERNLLDLGEFCVVYKGILKDKRIAAIKIFNTQRRGFESFEVQSQVLPFIRHRNVVKILKCCSDVDFKALVLEYIPNLSLQKWLYRIYPGSNILNFLKRLDIMINVASALCYLHTMRVIHCNLNPSNVLLDNDMVARVSGFSVAKCLEKGIGATNTTTMATAGYMAPEYESMGIVSEKTDVYSFGILLTETFTTTRPTEEMNRRSWICHSLQVVDTVVDLNFVHDGEEHLAAARRRCLRLILQLAYCCTAELSDERKTMREIESELVRIKKWFLSDN
ncbi:Leucine-rich repeat protein kinase family protein [Theobroma cacao]|uniref:non-specific serine/threonine protein kinase n=1 Tax=Theobroma cacao TaxID=3641 RepID=A0A061G6V5_THECC|nr:Leucine-rich repeat protein kinase family protein [Theobroma cacao]